MRGFHFCQVIWIIQDFSPVFKAPGSRSIRIKKYDTGEVPSKHASPPSSVLPFGSTLEDKACLSLQVWIALPPLSAPPDYYQWILKNSLILQSPESSHLKFLKEYGSSATEQNAWKKKKKCFLLMSSEEQQEEEGGAYPPPPARPPTPEKVFPPYCFDERTPGWSSFYHFWLVCVFIS